MHRLGVLTALFLAAGLSLRGFAVKQSGKKAHSGMTASCEF